MKSLPASALLAVALAVTALSFGYITFKSAETPPLVLAPQAQTAQVGSSLPSGLVAHLPFDNSVTDSLGNTTSWNGSASYSVGKVGSGSASFSGSNYVVINSQVYPVSGGTVAFWFKANSGTLTGSYGGSGNQRAPTLSISSTGNLKWEFSDFSDAGGDTGVKVADGQWHHAAMVYNTNQTKIYIDGSLVATDDVPAPSDFFDQVHIGHYGNYGSLFAKGLIDDFRIYNRELTAAQVSAIRAYTGVVADTAAPAISNVSVSGISMTEARLSWTTNEVADTYVSYGLTASYGNNSVLKDTGTGMVVSHTQTISGLQPGSTYNYRVTSKDAAGNSASSANGTFTTLAPPNSAPTITLAPISSTTVTPATITLSATASDSDGTISRVEFYNGAALLGSDTIAPYSYTWSGVVLGTYNITAKAVDNSGASATSNVQVASVTGCPAGTALSGTTCIPSSTAFKIGSRVQTYNTNTINVRQVPEGTILGTQSIGTSGTVVAGPSYAQGLWWWQVNYDSGADGWSVENFLKISPVTNPPITDTTAPSTPSNLTATAASVSQINLSWSPSTDTVGVTGYRIYRNGTQVATAVGTTYANTGLTPATSYSYRVAAYDAAGNLSPQSAAVSATTLTSTPTTYSVTITKSGTGSGTVTSTGSINCGTTCTANGTPGQTVTLTATPAAGSTFTGWSGACTGTATTCSFTLNANSTVNATFNTVAATTYSLSLTTSGSGSVTKTVNGSATTATSFPAGTAVTLSATPAAGYTFSGWSGACSGTGSCTVTMNANTAVTAAFSQIVTGGSNYYVTPTGAGARNGADWGNAYAGLPTSLVAGATYHLAPGSYPKLTVTSSGTAAAPITIRRSLELPANQPVAAADRVVFAGGSSVSGSNVIIDGKGWQGMSFGTSGSISMPSGAVANILTGSNVTLRNAFFEGNFNGAYASLGIRPPSTGVTRVEYTDFYKSSYEDIIGISPTATGGDIVFDHNVFRDNNNPGQTSAPHRDIVNTWTGTGGYGLVISNNIYYNTPGRAAIQGDGFLLQDSYGGSAAKLKKVEVFNNVAFGTARLIAFGSLNSGSNTFNVYNNTTIDTTFNSTFGVSSQSPAPAATFANNINNSTANAAFNNRNPSSIAAVYGADGRPFTADDAFALTSASTGAHNKATGSLIPSADIIGGARNGVADLGAYEYSGTVVPPTTYSVTITKSGTGSGTVTSTGSINCGTTCTANGTPGQTVTLTATPAAGSTFTGWSGACTGTATTCSFTLNSNSSVNATFNTVVVADPVVTITKSGTGSGTVTSTGSINCGSVCSSVGILGMTVNLTATPAAGSSFGGWSGVTGCSTATTCSFTLNANSTVNAAFNTVVVTNYSLSLTTSGSGSVTKTVNGSATTATSFPAGTAVTLSATPAAGYTFSGWSGACSGTGSCTVTMNANTAVTAAFSQIVTGGSNYYVTPTGAGLKNGTSWANAWADTTGIAWASVPAGSTIYLDGGVTSASYKAFTTGKGGTSNTARITIKRSEEAGHNGTVNLVSPIQVNHPYVTIDGVDRAKFIIKVSGGGTGAQGSVNVASAANYFEIKNSTLTGTFSGSWGHSLGIAAPTALVSRNLFNGSASEDQMNFTGSGGAYTIEYNTFQNNINNDSVHRDVANPYVSGGYDLNIIGNTVSNTKDVFLLQNPTKLKTVTIKDNTFTNTAYAFRFGTGSAKAESVIQSNNTFVNSQGIAL